MSTDPLAHRLVHAAGLALVEYTPGDDHTQPAARKATAAVLRELAAATDSRLSPARRAHLVVLANQIEAAASVSERTPT